MFSLAMMVCTAVLMFSSISSAVIPEWATRAMLQDADRQTRTRTGNKLAFCHTCYIELGCRTVYYMCICSYQNN